MVCSASFIAGPHGAHIRFSNGVHWRVSELLEEAHNHFNLRCRYQKYTFPSVVSNNFVFSVVFLEVVSP